MYVACAITYIYIYICMYIKYNITMYTRRVKHIIKELYRD